MKNRLYTLLCLLFVALTTFAYDVQIDSIYYYIDEYDKTATVTYNSESPYTQTEIVIPEKIVYNNKEYDVTSIGYDAFSGCSSLTSVYYCNAFSCLDTIVKDVPLQTENHRFGNSSSRSAENKRKYFITYHIFGG